MDGAAGSQDAVPDLLLVWRNPEDRARRMIQTAGFEVELDSFVGA